MGKRSRRKQMAAAGSERAAVASDRPLPESKALPLLIIAGLLLLVAIVFAQLRHHEFLNYDDPVYVTDNAHVRAGLTLAGVRWAFASFDFNWHPLTWLTHMADVAMFGIDSGAHLLMSVAWHAANTILLFLLFARLTSALWRSAIVAALFAIHPLHVESVAWLAERKDLVSAFFFLLTLWCYAAWARRNSRAMYALALVSLALGLMAKGMLVTTPFVLLLLDYWPLDRLRRENARQIAIEKIPFLVLAMAGVVVTYAAQRAVEATRSTEIVSLAGRLANAVLSYGAYLRKTFIPTGLALPYPYRLDVRIAGVIAVALLLAALTAAVVYFGRSRRYLITGWFWFGGMLVPVIGLIQIGSQAMADRYTYLPLIGLFIAIVWLVAGSVDSRPSLRPAAVFAAAAIVTLTWVAHLQASYWRDSATLFRHAVAVTGPNRIAHTNIGVALVRQGDYAAAADEFRAALAIHDSNDVAHTGLGAALKQLGDAAGAERELRKAIAQNPKNAAAYRNLGEIELARGRTREAEALFRQSLALKDDPQTRAALATAAGDIATALAQYRVAVDAEPLSADLQNDYAALLAQNGDDAAALAHYEEALRINPQHYDARMNIAALLSRLGRDAHAIPHLEAAAVARPRSPEPHVYLALVLANTGRRSEAAAEVEKALAIDPSAANAQFTAAVHMAAKESNLRDYLAFLRR